MGCWSWLGCDSMIELQLPYPPSVNQYYRKFRNVMVISDRGRKFRSDVQAVVGKARTMDGRLSVEIEVYPPDKRKRDIDNVCKATLDALAKAGVYRDDEQIDMLLITRQQVQKNGCLKVKIKEVKQSENQQRKASEVKADANLRRAGSRQIDVSQPVSKSDIFESGRRNSRS
jgi:crossover junction endodeoxyribonuclease RusA